MFFNIKSRIRAKKYNVDTERLDPTRKRVEFLAGHWYSDGHIWYGHPLFIFFISAHDYSFQREYGGIPRE